jgi:hypothetical protein
MDESFIDLDFDQISSLMSDLSQPGPVPANGRHQNTPKPFDADEVSYEGSEWLARLFDVSVWLNLDSVFVAEDAPADVARRLFEELSPDQPEGSFKVVDGNVVLTAEGVQALEGHLSVAITNRAIFQQRIEDDRSVVAATGDWLDAWSDPVLHEPLKINATVDSWIINTFAEYASQGDLDLNPSYQRDYIWSNADSQTLIESVLRGIPLPSIILEHKTEQEDYQVVDGKQRLTAILRFMGSHPEAIKSVPNMKEPALFHENFALFARRNNLRAVDLRQRYLPFKTKRYLPNDPLYELGGKYYCDIKDKRVTIAGKSITVEKLFQRQCDYKIPVLVYEDTKVRDIHRVFQIYNQQGTKLNAEEIRNAVFNHLLLSRAMLFVSGDRPEPAITPELAGKGVDPSQAHDIITSLGFGRTRFRRTKVLLWALSVLISKPNTADGGKSYSTPSTASHIDEFLSAIDENRLAQFKVIDEVVRVCNDLNSALQLHLEADDAWHPRFRRKGKSELASQWEELPVIASLVVCMVLVATGKERLLVDMVADVREATKSKVGPESTQNRTQWTHIASSAVSILRILQVDLDEAHKAVEDRYGNSALSALTIIAELQV